MHDFAAPGPQPRFQHLVFLTFSDVFAALALASIMVYYWHLQAVVILLLALVVWCMGGYTPEVAEQGCVIRISNDGIDVVRVVNTGPVHAA